MSLEWRSLARLYDRVRRQPSLTMAFPDPRQYGRADHALHELDGAALVRAFRELAAAGRDDDIRRALAAAPSHEAYVSLWRALCTAIEKPGSEDAVAPRVFAMPWVIVCSATANATVDCVLRDLSGLVQAFDRHGVFGPSRNLGLSNVLCSIDALDELPPSAVLRWTERSDQRDVAPAPIRLARGDEAVHVRFLLGAAVIPAHAPDIAETGSNIGAWGTPALHAMAAQLETPNAQLLPMPRPPAGLYTAAYAGRRAGLEAALNLFMSKAVRTMRLQVGDPSLTLATHEGGELRVTVWSPLDDALVEGFRWPLHPADDLDEIERVVTSLADECRLGEPAVVSRVLPDRTATGALLFAASEC